MTTENKNILKIFLLGATFMVLLAYTISVINNTSRSLYIILDHSIFYSLLTMVFLILIFFITNKIVKKVYKQKIINYVYQAIFTIASIAFIYEGTPKILHYLNKKNITIEAKIIHVNQNIVKSGSHASTRNTYHYNGYIIETPFSKLNRKEIFNYNYKLYPLLKKDTKIQIKGTTSDYMFKLNYIGILDKK